MAVRYAVFLMEETSSHITGAKWDTPRFNACFPDLDRAIDEVKWYIDRGYDTILTTVPDGLARYRLPRSRFWLSFTRIGGRSPIPEIDKHLRHTKRSGP